MTETQNRGKITAGKRLPKGLTMEMQNAIATNREKVMQEIQDSKALTSLLEKWGEGEALTTAQGANIKSQLGEICRSIPDLAPYLTPYGSILLAALLKKLPFNIMPAAVIASCAGVPQNN